jgi:hypothetical protein
LIVDQSRREIIKCLLLPGDGSAPSGEFIAIDLRTLLLLPPPPPCVLKNNETRFFHCFVFEHLRHAKKDSGMQNILSPLLEFIWKVQICN